MSYPVTNPSASRPGRRFDHAAAIVKAPAERVDPHARQAAQINCNWESSIVCRH